MDKRKGCLLFRGFVVLTMGQGGQKSRKISRHHMYTATQADRKGRRPLPLLSMPMHVIEFAYTHRPPNSQVGIMTKVTSTCASVRHSAQQSGWWQAGGPHPHCTQSERGQLGKPEGTSTSFISGKTLNWIDRHNSTFPSLGMCTQA